MMQYVVIDTCYRIVGINLFIFNLCEIVVIQWLNVIVISLTLISLCKSPGTYGRSVLM